MIEKEFIPYEQALALKELGFDEPCFGYFNKTWSKENELLFPQYVGELENWNNTQHLCSAPTFSQAFRWFREKYGLCSWIERMYTADSICYYRYTCEYKKDPSSKTHEVILSIKEYNTYEEAELACLKKLIEIVKQQP